MMWSRKRRHALHGHRPASRPGWGGAVQLRAHSGGCGASDFWGSDQAVGCGRSTCVQKAQGEPEWLRTLGRQASGLRAQPRPPATPP